MIVANTEEEEHNVMRLVEVIRGNPLTLPMAGSGAEGDEEARESCLPQVRHIDTA